MILRPRQEEFVKKATEALHKHGDTLGVAPTGAGKTVMLSHVASQFPTSLIIQHRDELVAQNLKTFRRVNPNTKFDVFNADRKRFLNPGTTFAMIQTLSRVSNLDLMKPVDLVIVDEAHHAAADGYVRTIERAKNLNPNVKLFGVTATPVRGDRKALKGIFTNVCDQIEIGELIRSGHLVRPRTFVIDCGFKQEMDRLREEARKLKFSDIDMVQVAEIMDKQAVTDRVIEEWRKHAGDRRTIAFCSTVDHARHVCEYFSSNGISAGLIWGEMPDGERKSVLADLDSGKIQVCVNVAVLTEGFDSQPVSCILLLRPCSHKSTMIQMIGRGLRTVDQERYPGIIKDDCVVLDFGYSLLTHGSIETSADLEPKKKKEDEQLSSAPMMTCEACKRQIPIQSSICPLCGADIPKEEKEGLEDFVMCEIDIINASPFRWEKFFDDVVWICQGMTAWAVCVPYGKRWYAVGGTDIKYSEKLIGHCADSFSTLAKADDFMRLNGDKDSAQKTKRWLSLPATDKQLQTLCIDPGQSIFLTRYRASCAIQWKFKEYVIKRIVTSAHECLPK